MENQNLLIFVLSHLIIIFILFKIIRKKSKSKSTNLPPGPPKLPLIGNMHQLFTSSAPHQRLKELSEKYGSIMTLQLGEITNIVISSPEIAKQILKTHDLAFAQRPSVKATNIITYGSSDIVFSPYSDYWRQIRKICILEVLSAKRVQSFRAIREEEGSNLIKTILSYSGEGFNFSKMVFASTCGITARAVFGAKCKEQDEFRPLAQEIPQVLVKFNIADLFPSVKFLSVFSGLSSIRKLHQELDRIFENIIRQRKDLRKRELKDDRKGEEDNLLDVLLRVQEDGDPEFQLTDNNMKAVILDIFVAGTESSSTTTEWVMSELVRNPRVMQKAQEEVRRVYGTKGKVDEQELHQLDYLRLVIKETMRLHPPAPLLLPRQSRESCEINGFNIPADSHITINAWALGRDPSFWEDAEKFDPERFVNSPVDFKGNDFQFIPFGAGRRICPGVSFALANVELSLANFLYHFDWKLLNGMKFENLDMAEASGVTMRRKNDLHLIAIPHFSTSI
ncbi:cytochrome P450 family 71 subfamily B polypeptide 2 [Euphorbia peplus]|nr:cytochrome P450 family 71 subfamily B polypeptide 2 [Euphorbia peplus]